MARITRLGRFTALAAALLAAQLSIAIERGAQPGTIDPHKAMRAPLATKAPLTAAARAGQGWVAVGDFGVVLTSADGSKWEQAQSVPFDGLLTAVTFVSEREGWAVGHGGTVLRTADGGQNWERQASLEGQPVLLSVWFKDASQGIVTGAYGAAFATEDGGRTWNPITVREGRDGEIHLNHVFAGRDGTLYIAAEMGAAFRSTDGGASWTSLETGASGSLWSGTALEDGTLLLIGMTGRILVSRDGGAKWSELPSGTEQALTNIVETEGGGFLAVGNGGAVLTAEPGLARVSAAIRPDRQNLAALALRPDGRPVFLGQLGVINDEFAKR